MARPELPAVVRADMDRFHALAVQAQEAWAAGDDARVQALADEMLPAAARVAAYLRAAQALPVWRGRYV
jgi:hypothetical protein